MRIKRVKRVACFCNSILIKLAHTFTCTANCCSFGPDNNNIVWGLVSCRAGSSQVALQSCETARHCKMTFVDKFIKNVKILCHPF